MGLSVFLGHHRFFLGSDSAPHPLHMKLAAHSCFGVFTSPYVLPLLAQLFEHMGCLDKLRSFACEFGRQFYGLEAAPESPTVRLIRVQEDDDDSVRRVQPLFKDSAEEEEPGLVVVPFKNGLELDWRIDPASLQ